MDKFDPISKVGEGTFGCVWKALNTHTGEVVAIKQLKGATFYTQQQCLDLPEVKALRTLNNHPNIVKLKELVCENGSLFFVFECMEANLFQFITTSQRDTPPDESHIRKWCFQVLGALAYMHRNGYIHRDLKPENLLVSNAGSVVKLADFGLALDYTSSHPPYTHYVGTRPYRAPEMLLQSPSYDSSVDMWAVGAITAELFTRTPLFPGTSDPDQFYRICRVLGTPNGYTWPDGLRLADALHYEFPQLPGIPLSRLIPSASPEALDLISSLCSWDPRKRPTAQQALHHPFFRSCFPIPTSLRPTLPAPKVPPGFAKTASPLPAPPIPPGFAAMANPKRCQPPPALLNANQTTHAAAATAHLGKDLTQNTLNSGQQKHATQAAYWNATTLSCSHLLATAT